MPLALTTSVLASGFLPLFREETAPQTTFGAAQAWANAYQAWTLAGGVVGGEAKLSSFVSNLEHAFNPSTGGSGPALWLSAMVSFWSGLSALTGTLILGTAAIFTPRSLSINGDMSTTATPEQQASALASVVSSITISSVMVTTPAGQVPVI